MFIGTHCTTCCRYDPDWIGTAGLSGETHQYYLNQFVKDFYKGIVKQIERGTAKLDNTEQVSLIIDY